MKTDGEISYYHESGKKIRTCSVGLVVRDTGYSKEIRVTSWDSK